MPPKQKRGGVFSVCSPTMPEKQRRKVYKARWRQKNQATIRAYKLKLYGLTPEDYALLFDYQHGLCAICGKAERSHSNGKVRALAVDHNHRTNLVRGLLCDKCNRAVGFLDDDPLRADALARYLRENGSR